MRTSVESPTARRWAVCLALLILGMALPLLGAQEADPKKETLTPWPLTPAEAGALPKALLEQARDDVELVETQLAVHKAAVEEAAVRLKLAKEQLDRIEPAAQAAAVPQSRLAQARSEAEILQAQVKMKQAEQRVAEVRLGQAQRRLARLPGEPKDKGKTPPANSKSADLARERLAVLDQLDRLRADAAKGGQKLATSVDMEGEYLWSRRRMDAERAASDKIAHAAAAVEAHGKRMRELEERAQKLVAAGQASPADVLAARFYRLEAEAWLLEGRNPKEEKR